MLSKYERLFEVGYIGGLRIKNRVVMTAMGNGLAAENGEASDEIIECYKMRAAGGCGLLITEFCAVDGENGIAETHQLQIHSPRFIKRLALLTDTLHRYDCKVFFQLFHPGREGKPQFNGGRQVISASGIVNPANGMISHEMTVDEIHEMVKKFVNGAVYAQQANADGVEIHCAHGYLLHQFISPHSNVRTDEYGGSLENRMRIVKEIIEGIHRECGKDFPISARINGCDYIPEGLKKEDAVEIAKLLESYGVSCINVSSGGYENPAAFIEPCYFPEGWKKENAEAVKAALKIPVIAVNVIKRPETAEALLRESVCDFVGVSRGQLADPGWVEKARTGQEHLLRKCIGCMSCNKEVVNHRGIRCAINPRLGRELSYNDEKMKRNGMGRCVPVIGGGPAGMQASIVLAQRGFKPILFEKKGYLGGSAVLASKAPCKGLVAEYIETQKNQLAELGVQIYLNCAPDIEQLKSLNPYGVFVTMGGLQIVPDIPGIHADNVYGIEDILLGRKTLENKNVVVVGGGHVGLETAHFLCGKNKVTIVEMTDVIGASVYYITKFKLLPMLRECGVDFITGHALSTVEADKVSLKDMHSGQTAVLDADAVVLAMGSRPDLKARELFDRSFEKVVYAGDAVKGGTMLEANRDAFALAWEF